jgi:hypothetical protein
VTLFLIWDSSELSHLLQLGTILNPAYVDVSIIHAFRKGLNLE